MKGSFLNHLFALLFLYTVLNFSILKGQPPGPVGYSQDPTSEPATESKIGQNPELAPQLELALQQEEKGKQLPRHAIKTATTYYHKAHSIHLHLNNHEGVVRVSQKLGACYLQLSDYHSALTYIFPVLASYTELRDTIGMAKMHHKISSIYASKKEYTTSLYHGKEALRLSQAIGDQEKISDESNHLAELYVQVDSTQIALDHLFIAKNINLETCNQHSLGMNSTVYASIFKKLGKTDSVKHYLFDGLVQFQKSGKLENSLPLFTELAILHEEAGSPDSALFYLNKGIRFSAQTENLWLEANLNYRASRVHKNNGEPQMATPYLNAYNVLNDSIDSLQKWDEMEAVRALDEVKQLEDSLAWSQVNEALAQKDASQKEIQLYTVSCIFMVFIVFGFVIFAQQRKQSRTNAHLLKMNLDAHKASLSAKTTNNPTPSPSPSPKYASSALSDTKIEPILESLIKLMKEDQLYTDQTLKLEMVAQRLDVSRTYLSQVINQTFSQNFNSYINFHRIQLAKTYLVSEAYHAYSIQGIAETVGFKSLSAFNSAFKKETGLTPSYYRKNASPKKT